MLSLPGATLNDEKIPKADKIRRILAGWLLVLLSGTWPGRLFYHTHIVNGIRITHSHPYSQTPDTGNHTHTTTGFATIAQLTLILMLAASFYALLRPSLSGQPG